MGKLIPDKLPQKHSRAGWSEERRMETKLKNIREGKGALYQVLKNMSGVTKRVAEVLLKNPFASPHAVSKELELPYYSVVKAFDDPEVIKVCNLNMESEANHIRRLRMKSRHVLETALGAHLDYALDAAKFIEKKTFDAPQTVNIQVPVMTPDALRDLAKKVIDVTPDQPVDNFVHSPVDKSSNDAVNETTGHDEFPLD